MSFIKIASKLEWKKAEKSPIGPLADLGESSSKINVYRYPEDVGDFGIYPHTIEFSAYTPLPEPLDDVAESTKTSASSFLNKVKDAGSKFLNEEEGQTSFDAKRFFGSDKNQAVLTVDKNRAGRSGNYIPSRRAVLTDIIHMYIPHQVQEQHNNDYETQSITKALGTAGFFMDVGSSILDEVVSGNSVKSLTPAVIEGIARAVQAAGGLGMDTATLQAAGLQALGFATNPRLEIIYNQTKLREFVFDFRMTPRTPQESVEINTIISKFKYHASPQLVNNQGRYLTPPSYFEIAYKFKARDNPFLHKISTCVLTSMDIDYVAGLEQFATYDTGMPTQIAMILRFTEMEVIHKGMRKINSIPVTY